MSERRDEFRELIDLAAERLGGRVLSTSDEFFAPGANLLRPGRGVFEPDRYTDRGKWMDGWETRRRRGPGHDWCVIGLGVPGAVRGLIVDTNHFRGNHPESASVEVCLAGDAGAVPGPAASWREILPRAPLRGHAENIFAVDDDAPCTHVRLSIFPDGGVARLRVHGEPRPDWARLGQAGGPVDLAAAALGGRVVACSDCFFSAPANLLLPGPAANMGEGWETRRRRGPGHDWCVIRLACRGALEAVEVDTTHFKGNYPDRCALDAAAGDADGAGADLAWTPLVPEQPLRAHDVHRFSIDAGRRGPWTHVRLSIFPDGGVARLRVHGRRAGGDAAGDRDRG